MKWRTRRSKYPFLPSSQSSAAVQFCLAIVWPSRKLTPWSGDSLTIKETDTAINHLTRIATGYRVCFISSTERERLFSTPLPLLPTTTDKWDNESHWWSNYSHWKLPKIIVCRSVSLYTLLPFPEMMMMSWCLMSSDVIWHIRDKLWPMPKHGSIKSTYVRCMRV